ncbi:MAG TPA: class I SAM-dependent methyltransferase [Xanthobacteraceae bacterium]|nr:class I SAM-dependent methyltransferase [Xanthobacteraceae bacterium]
MTRIFTQAGEEAPPIDEDAVVDFFEARARKVGDLGPLKAVLYQDKHADLAERRDVAEKAVIFPILELSDASRVLDAGCGVGRWAALVRGTGAYYHGADVSSGLIKVAQETYGNDDKIRFSVCAIDTLSLEQLQETAPFTHLVCFGVFIYLNDPTLKIALRRLVEMAAPKARIVFREPLSSGGRLTLSEHFSEDMDQVYHAIYRSENEFLAEKTAILGATGFKLCRSGDVYANHELNNRRETRQRYFVWERG